MKEKKKMSLAMQIFIALVLAIIAGLLMQNYADFATNYIKPFGTIFLNLIKFIVCPIVLFSIMCGIISMSDIRKVGSIGLKTVVFYLCTTAFAVTIGLVGGNLFKGMFPVVATTDLSYEAAEATSFMDTLVNIFPSNFISPMVEANMLQVIVMAIILGFAIILVGEKNVRVVNAFNDLNEIFMKCMEMILKLPAVPGYCIQWSDHHRFSGYGTAGCLYLLFCTCSGCLLSDSQHTGRHESCEILQRNDAGDHVCIFQCIFCGNSADQLKLYREACKT